VARPPQEWFLNTPVLWFAGITFTLVLRGPLRSAPALIRKILKFATVSLFALGFALLLLSSPVQKAVKHSPALTAFWVVLSGLTPIAWIVLAFRVFSRRQPRVRAISTAQSTGPALHPAQQTFVRNVPNDRFADLGGMDEAKDQIRQMVEAQLKPERSKRYGLSRNGILLYGPRGTGKTLLARAAAGEFGLNLVYVSAPKLLNRWIGATGENIHAAFADAAARKPALLFIDEIDSLGAGRQDAMADPGGAGREFNNVTMALMSAIDQYRETGGLVLMAATNRLDGLDDALLREGRFDLKLRIDLPDENERLRILEARLRKKPSSRFDLREFARLTPGASPSKLAALIDQATTYAFADNRKITSADLYRALNERGGKDRPQLERVEWEQVVIDESVKQDIQSLIRLLENGAKTREMGLEVPSGLLLIGPPGTGKSLVARLIASQTKRSFYPVSAANVLGSGVGDSVKRVSTLFSRAKEHSPSIIFFDEMDGLLPANNRNRSQHDIQVVEQFLTEISELKSQNELFLIGTTNNPENIDPRVLRGGRFSEKIAIPLPRVEQRVQLLKIFLNGTRLDTGLGIDEIAANLDGASSADLQAICIAAKRMAFNRLTDGDSLPPLIGSDFDRAAQRVLGSDAQADNTFRPAL
jgi:transitional endoplasmic reticulum ATPase